jgi:hypothetical protein
VAVAEDFNSTNLQQLVAVRTIRNTACLAAHEDDDDDDDGNTANSNSNNNSNDNNTVAACLRRPPPPLSRLAPKVRQPVQ